MLHLISGMCKNSKDNILALIGPSVMMDEKGGRRAVGGLSLASI